MIRFLVLDANVMTMPDGSMWEEIGGDGKPKKKGILNLPYSL